MTTVNVVYNAPDPWEPGENFSFISETAEVFSSCSNKLTGIKTKVNLVATAGKYGFIFVSDQSCIKVFQTSSIIDARDPQPFKTIDGRGRITHLSTSCDFQTLLVVTVIKDTSFALFYDVFSLVSMTLPPSPFYFAPLSSNLGSSAVSIAWNPCDSCCVAIVLSDGDLIMIKIKNSSVEFNTQKNGNASAVTWSAKGKQLAVGKTDASVALFKPDLTPVRTIERPPQKPEIGVVISLTWFTNTEFFIGYLCNNVVPVLFYVNAPKGKPAIYRTFEDVCYSNEKEKPINYYTHFFNEWNVLLVLSTHSVEMGILGKHISNDSANCDWRQWSPDDGAQATLKFVNVVEETFPLGFAIDLTSKRTMVAKDESIRGPFPVVLALSTGGELNSFFVENKLEGNSSLALTKEAVPTTGFRTPQQYGQQVLTLPEQPQPVINLERSASSAFSSVAGKPFAFSTPIKPPSESSQKSFSSSFVTKPVSLSSEVGANRSTFLHVPSPKKTLTPSPLASPLPVYPVIQTTGLNIQPVSVPVQPSPLHAQPGALQSVVITKVAPIIPEVQSIKKEFTPAIQIPVKAVPKATVPKQPPKISKEQLLHIIQNETRQFEEELLSHRKSNASIKYEVGTKGDESKESSQLVDIKGWMKEMKATTREQNDEVSQLHKKVFEGLASYEDANAHKEYSSRNQMYMQLRPLDPYSQRRLDEIRTKYQYLLSQLGEVNTKLDLQWEDYSSAKNISRKEQASVKNLYRSVLNLHTARVTAEKQLDSLCHKFKRMSYSSFDPCFVQEVSPSRQSFQISPKRGQVSPKSNSHLAEVLSQRSITPIRKNVDSTNKRRPPTEDNLSERSCSPLTGNAPIYEEISPPESPQKNLSDSALTVNPLGALSSLIGKVTDTNLTISERKPNPPLFGSRAPPSTPTLLYSDAKNVPTSSGSIFSFGPKPLVAATNINRESALFNTDKNKVTTPSSNILFNFTSPSLTATTAKVLFSPSQDLNNSAKSQAATMSNPELNFSTFMGLPKAITQEVNLLSFGDQNKTSVIGQTNSTSSASHSEQKKEVSLFGDSSDSGIFVSKVTASSNSMSSQIKSSFSTAKLPSKLLESLIENEPISAKKLPIKTEVPVIIDNSSSKSQFGSSPIFSQSNSLLSSLFSTTQSHASSLFGQPKSSTRSQDISLFSQSVTLTTGSENSAHTGLLTATNQSQATSFNQLSSGGQVDSVLTSNDQPQSSTLFGQLSSAVKLTTHQSQSSTLGSVESLNAQSKISSLFEQVASVAKSQGHSLGSQDTSNSSTELTTAESTSHSDIIFSQTATTGQNKRNSAPFDKLAPVSSSDSLLGQRVITNSSLFGQSAPCSTSSSLFDDQSVSASSNNSLFGQSTPSSTSSTLFGHSTTVSLFGQLAPASSSSSLFGQSVPVSSSSSLFSLSPVSTSSSLFGQSVSVSTNSSLFAQGAPVSISSSMPAPISSCSSLFDQSPSISISSSMFDHLAPASTISSLFGQTISVSTSSAQFDQPASITNAGGCSQFEKLALVSSSILPLVQSAPVSSTSTLFGQAVPVSSSSSLFNQLTSGSSGNALFGQSVSVSTSSSLFGQSAPISSSSSLIIQSTPVSSSSFLFDQSVPVSGSGLFAKSLTQSSNIFGGPISSTGQPSAAQSVFGQTVQVSPKSIFGQSTSTSIFGGQSNLGSSATLNKSIFGESAKFNSSSSFGQPSPSTDSASLFGGTSSFGKQNSSETSVFGSTSSSIFGGGSVATTATVTSNQQSLFSSGFGQQSLSTIPDPSLFSSESLFSGLGKPASQENASKNVFGSSAGATSGTTQTNLFGGAALSPFGAKPSESSTILPPKSGGAFSPVKSAFGASPSFGGAPIFGGSSAFGSPPSAGSTFGAAGSTFGAGGSTFGAAGSSSFGVSGGNASPFGGNAFGAGSNASGFGSLTSGESSFGNLAKQTSTNDNPQSTFGGTSFSSWR